MNRTIRSSKLRRSGLSWRGPPLCTMYHSLRLACYVDTFQSLALRLPCLLRGGRRLFYCLGRSNAPTTTSSRSSRCECGRRIELAGQVHVTVRQPSGVLPSYLDLIASWPCSPHPVAMQRGSAAMTCWGWTHSLDFIGSSRGAVGTYRNDTRGMYGTSMGLCR